VGTIVTVIFGFTVHADEVKGITYYVDSVNGSDDNAGTSRSEPWKTLSKVNSIMLLPGDHILFKAGGLWNGQFWPKGSGTPENPIVVDMYGSGDKPIISGNGTTYPKSSATIMLYQTGYFELNNLEITNYSNTVTSMRSGVLIQSPGISTNNHIYISDCYVHDVNSDSSLKDKGTGGIIISNTSYDKENIDTGIIGYFNDVVVENCKVKTVDVEGIRVAGGGDRLNNDIIIRNNTVDDIAGDGIVLKNVGSGGIVEGNIISRHCRANWGNLNFAGCWNYNCENAVFQNNEVYGGVYGYNDGEAFDIDLYNKGTVMQYNYSHNNPGGFCLFMNGSTDSVFRYNISENDGNGNGQEIFHYLPSNSTDAPLIYNNTVYVGSGVNTID